MYETHTEMRVLGRAKRAAMRSAARQELKQANAGRATRLGAGCDGQGDEEDWQADVALGLKKRQLKSILYSKSGGDVAMESAPQVLWPHGPDEQPKHSHNSVQYNARGCCEQGPAACSTHQPESKQLAQTALSYISAAIDQSLKKAPNQVRKPGFVVNTIESTMSESSGVAPASASCHTQPLEARPLIRRTAWSRSASTSQGAAASSTIRADVAQRLPSSSNWRQLLGAGGTPVDQRRDSPMVELSMLLAECVQHGLRTIAFCKTRKLSELVTAYTREILKSTAPELVNKVKVGAQLTTGGNEDLI